MTTRLLLVRHGATQLSAEDKFAGAIGVDLSEEGRAQVRTLAERLGKETISAVYASPLGRTTETAKILAEPHGLPVVPRDGLRGDRARTLGGHGAARRGEEVPGGVRRVGGRPVHVRPGRRRVGPLGPGPGAAGVRAVVAAHPDANVLVVSHKATLRLLLSSLLGFDPRGYRDRLDQSPACLNVVDFKDTVRARLMLFNDVSHYQSAPRRGGGNLSRWWDTPKTT